MLSNHVADLSGEGCRLEWDAFTDIFLKNNTLEEKFGKPGEKSLDCRPNWRQTELKYDACSGMELKPQGGGVGLFLQLLHLRLGQRVERNPKCSLK